MPKDFFNSFQGLIIGAIDESDYPGASLKRVCDIIAKNLPARPTTNTGYSWLIGDLDDFMRKLQSKKLPKILDTIAEISEETEMDLDEINDLFEEIEFGYTISRDRYDGTMWEITKDAESSVESIEEGLKEASEEQTNVLEHLRQAKRHMENISDERSRKDALRDCASALESQLEYYTQKTKLEDAVRTIKTADNNIPRKIIDDAKTIWDRIHQETPDVRHGSAITSDLSEAEALYWIDRIMALVKYLARELED